MNKKIKKVLAIIMSAMMLFTVACGKGGSSEPKDKDKTLYVAAINKGYGIDWLEAMLEEFCESKGWSYVLYPVYTDGELTQKIEAGEIACDYDLVFTGAGMIADEKFLMDLTDVLESTIEEGDRAGKKISEVMDVNVYNALQNEDGKYYKLPWTGGINGLIYNNDAIGKVLGKNWQEKYPCRTTNELIAFCKTLQAAGLAPFIHSAETNYYSFFYEAWFAQYNGSEGLNDYYNAKFSDFLGEETVGVGVARNAGVLESAKVMESIFSNGYSHEKSNSIDWEVTQTMFMAGESAMFSNGDWNHTEMMKQFPNSDIRFMRLPIISALGTKLGITEEQLIKVVDYVDGKGETPGVSSDKYSEEQIIDLVKEARTWAASYADAHNLFVPIYTKKADMVKEFLKYMVSDAGQHTFSTNTGGLTMCYGYNLEEDAEFESFSTFAKTRWDIAQDVNLFITSRSEAYARVGLAPFKARALAPLEVLLSRKDDRYTAQMIYDYDYEYWKNNWNLLTSQLK